MTAILKRGDRIHLAFPIDANRDKKAATELALETMEALSAVYAAEGVTIVRWNAHDQLTAPVVVAVFRNEGDE